MSQRALTRLIDLFCGLVNVKSPTKLQYHKEAVNNKLTTFDLYIHFIYMHKCIDWQIYLRTCTAASMERELTDEKKRKILNTEGDVGQKGGKGGLVLKLNCKGGSWKGGRRR